MLHEVFVCLHGKLRSIGIICGFFPSTVLVNMKTRCILPRWVGGRLFIEPPFVATPNVRGPMQRLGTCSFSCAHLVTWLASTDHNAIH